jgi:hypothetical protein
MFDFRIVLTVWYFRIVLTVWYVTGVTVVDFSRINLQQIDHVLNDQKSHIQDEFEDTKGESETYIEEEQTTHWPKEKVQKVKQLQRVKVAPEYD